MDDAYLQPYRESARRHGTDFEVTMWADEESQYLRFEIFTQMYAFAGRRILDAGANRGDFAQYLLERGIDYERFIGVDGIDDVIAYAASRGLADCEFHAGDFVRDPDLLRIGEPDVICISGALTTMTDEQVQKVLESAWDATGDALLFNFLSDRAGPDAWLQLKPTRRLDTLKLFEWAMSKTDCVAFRQDYFDHGHDATILMRRS